MNNEILQDLVKIALRLDMFKYLIDAGLAKPISTWSDAVDVFSAETLFSLAAIVTDAGQSIDWLFELCQEVFNEYKPEVA